MNTTEVWVAFNASENGVTTQPIPEQSESRLEIISDRCLDGERDSVKQSVFNFKPINDVSVS